MSFERIRKSVSKLAMFPLIAAFALMVSLVFPPPKSADAANARATMFTEAVSDPASLADGAGVSNDIAAEGAVLGDFCLASFSVDVVDLSVTCNITAANVATVRHQNESGGAVDLAAYTVRVIVFKANQF
jgi:hypothetical protein